MGPLSSEKISSHKLTSDPISCLLEIPKRNKNRVFLVDGIENREWTFGQIHEQACAISEWLHRHGLKKGDRLAAVLPNASSTVRLYFGCLYAGIVIVPLNPISSPKEMEFIIRDSSAKMIVLSNREINKIKDVNLPKDIQIITLGGLDEESDCEVLNLNRLSLSAQDFSFKNVTANDDLIIIYTSGTTADPKGVIHRIADLVHNGKAFGELFGIGHENRFYNNLALTYLGGYYNLLLLPYVCESSIVLSETFNPASVINFWGPIMQHQVNTLWLVPSLMAILLEMDRSNQGERYCNEKVKLIFAGMAPLPPAIRIKFEERYRQPVYENYGLSETLFISTNQPGIPIQDGSVGTILSGVQISIRDKDENELSNEEEGEIWVKTPYLMRGYVERLKQNKSWELSTQDWFPTGDLGVLSIDKMLSITGRKKDLIIRGGINISPASIENTLYLHPAVMECAVVGVPHKFSGEEVVAVVRLVEGSNSGEVRKELVVLCQKNLARIKQPSQFVEVIEFSHTTSGKIQKRKIRAWLMQRNEVLITPPTVIPASKSEPHFMPSKIVEASVEAMSIKFNTMVYEMQREKIDVTVLSLGEAFFDIPLFDFSSLPFPNIYHYSHPRGIPELRETLAKYFQDEYDVTFNPKNEILITAGSKIAIHMTLMTVINPGDEVLYYEPAWVSYPEQIKLCYGVPVPIPYYEKISNFENYITNRTRMLIINNPTNPTGRVLNLDELGYLHTLAKKYNLFVLSDEAYSDFLLNDGEFISLANLDIEKQHTLIVNSLSKNFGMSGWRLGYVIANPALIEQILKINQHLVTCPPTILEYYATKYFDEIIRVTKPQIRNLVTRRAQIQEFMDELGLAYMSGTATFYLFVSIDPSKLSSVDFCMQFLERYHVCVVPGIGYGKSCDRFVRVSVGTESLSRLKRALKLLKDFIKESSK